MNLAVVNVSYGVLMMMQPLSSASFFIVFVGVDPWHITRHFAPSSIAVKCVSKRFPVTTRSFSSMKPSIISGLEAAIVTLPFSNTSLWSPHIILPLSVSAMLENLVLAVASTWLSLSSIYDLAISVIETIPCTLPSDSTGTDLASCSAISSHALFMESSLSMPAIMLRSISLISGCTVPRYSGTSTPKYLSTNFVSSFTIPALQAM